MYLKYFAFFFEKIQCTQNTSRSILSSRGVL
jgi:hypothetical protein